MWYRYFILVFILLISCEQNDIEVTITGKVTDAVTGAPVEGAIVSLCIYYNCEGKVYTNILDGSSCQSGPDGMFAYNYKYNNDKPPVFEDKCSLNRPRAYPFPQLYNVYARKSGFITSDYHSLSDNIINSADIKMYHSAQLNIHVKNEGINMLNGARVCIDRGSGFTFFGTPQFIFSCVGYNFDSEYILKDLWGGFHYLCKVIPLNGSTYTPNPYVNTSILLIPDTINYLSISF